MRYRGLPLMVPPLRRLVGLVPRSIPLLVSLALLGTALLLADRAVNAGEVISVIDLKRHPEVLNRLVVASIVGLLAIPVGFGYAILQRRLSPGLRLVIATAILLFWLPGLSAWAGLEGAGEGLHLGIWVRLGLLVVAVASVYLGLDSITGWALRRGLNEISSALPAIARVLPLLLLTVLLVFFTEELWQISANMSKARMWALGLFLVALIALIVLPNAMEMIDEDLVIDPEGPLAGTPFAGLPETASPLRLGERINLLVMAMSVQFAQITFFVLVTFGVFAAIGVITVDDVLIERWSQAAPHPVIWLGLRLPFDAAMFRVCLTLALFSGITFAASTLQDPLYRKLFLDPVAEEVQVNLAARHRYRSNLSAPRCGRWQALLRNADD